MSLLSAPIKREYESAEKAAKAAAEDFKGKRDEYVAAEVDPKDTDHPLWREVDESHAAKVNADMNATALRDKLFKALQMDGEPAPGMADPGEVRNEGDRRRAMSYADRVLETPEAKELMAWAERQTKTGIGGTRGLGQAANRDELMHLLAPRNALITGTSDTGGGAFITPDRKPYVGLAERPPTVLDVISIGATNSDLVEYVQQTSHTVGAAFTAEATTAASGSVDGIKPEGSLGFDIVQEAVKNVAEIIPVTRRAFADAGQLRTYIEQALRYDHRRVVENDVVNGPGTGQRLRGITATAGVNVYDANGAPDKDDLYAIRHAMTLIELDEESEATAVLVNPADAEIQDLYRDASGGAGTGQYLAGNPFNSGPSTLWGLPRIKTTAIPAGTAIVGGFNWATLWVREGANILVSDSHLGWFASNILALLCEGRYAMTVSRPSAFCVVTLGR